MRHRRGQTAARNIVIFLAAFAGFEWVVGRVSPPFQGADKVERKFAYFAAHKDEFDVVFVGSSRVLNQISPRVFDQAMVAAGYPCRSINLGYAGMFLPESSFLVDRICELHPARLRTMVVELSDHTPRRDDEPVLTAREIYWHRPASTALACATVLTDPASDFPLTERAGQIARQFGLLARCLLHLGTGPDLWEHGQRGLRRQNTASEPTREALGPELDGFSPLETTLGHGTSGAFKTGGTSADLARYQTSVAALRADARSPSRASTPSTPGAALGERIVRQVIEHQVASLRNTGIEPVYFIGPVTTREQPFLDLAARKIVPDLLAFNDPSAYPDLYRPELRADRYHLNSQGAVILTRLLAQRLDPAGTAKRPEPSGAASQ